MLNSLPQGPEKGSAMRDQDLSSREPGTPAEPARGEPAFAAAADHAPSTGRRQFLKKAALTSAPVILTVASRPAWGTPHFCTPSGWCSGASVPEEAWAECATGSDADAYAADSTLWPIDGNKTYFGPGNQTPYVFDVGDNDKLKQIIDNNNGKYSEFMRAAVAAYLNALSDPTYEPTLSALQCIVRDILTDGTFSTIGCHWNELEALDYLQSTFML